MDDETLRSLGAALEASPDNLALRLVLARAHLDREQPEEACELLVGRDLAGLSEPGDAATAARALREGGRLEEALEVAQGDAPELALERARALLALGRDLEARTHYAAAVEGNPTLEDGELARALHPGEPQLERGHLRLVAEDDEDPTLRLLLQPEQRSVRFEDVGGLDHVKKQVRRRIILPFQKPGLFSRFRKRVGGGILLYGPPGCGKTLLARATAGECEAAFFNVAISDILDMWVGESEAKMHAIFEKARSSTPSVIFFDEVEALGGKRQHARDHVGAKVVSQFLAEMDGFAQDNQGVLILGATNVPWAVDPAFRRPGRFDRTLFVPPPDREARERILSIHLEGRPVADDVKLATLARDTGSYSGADLEGLVEAAADEAIAETLETEKEVPLRQAHFREALKDLRPTTLEWLTTARNHARYANEGGQYDEVLRFLDRFEKRR